MPGDAIIQDTILAFETVRLGGPAAVWTARRPWDLALAPGDLVLIDAGGMDAEEAVVDAALGLVAPSGGAVRLLGHDWQGLPRRFAAALRGRVGLIPRQQGWLGHLPTVANVLLRPQYHLRTPTAELVEQARRLAERFTLPGLPLDPIEALHPRDRLRAACVRGLVGAPLLVIVETQLDAGWGSLLEPLVASLQEVRERGGAVLWCLTDDPLFGDLTLPADRRLRLRGRQRPAAAA